MTPFGTMKHLKVLEGAGLVITRRSGREKHHFLNRVPIQVVYDRWVSKFACPDRNVHRTLKPEALRSTIDPLRSIATSFDSSPSATSPRSEQTS